MLAREVMRAQATQNQQPPSRASPLATISNQASVREGFKSSPPSPYRYGAASRSVGSNFGGSQTPFALSKASSSALKRSLTKSQGFLGSFSEENQAPAISQQDLPKMNGISKLHGDVYFNEHDFDDEVDLDSDGATPVGQSFIAQHVAYPPLPETVHTLATPKTTAPGRAAGLPTASQQATHSSQPKPVNTIVAPTRTTPAKLKFTNSTPIGWSSSPLQHKATPPNASLLHRPAHPTTPSQSHSVEIDLTQEDSEDLNPRPKKRRSLPWQQSREEDKEAQSQSGYFQRPSKTLTGPARNKIVNGTPKHSTFSRAPAAELETPKATVTPVWDKTASAIKAEHKKLRKTNKKVGTNNDDEVRDGTRKVVSSRKGQPQAIFFSEEQKRILELVVEKGKSVFFTGSAGTGKSVLLREIIACLRMKHRREPDRVAVTASTGLAACNVGGVTLHSFSGIGLGKEKAEDLVKKIKKNQKAKNRWARTKVLIVDEISMVDGDLFDKLEFIAKKIRGNGKPFGGIQLIITGDFFQLPPVPDYGKPAKFAFDAGTWPTSIEHTIGLTQVFRQKDPVFANVLNEMRLGILSPESIQIFRSLNRPITYEDNIDGTELFPTRHEVENANRNRMRNLTGNSHIFSARDAGTIQNKEQRDKLLSNCMAPVELELKKGAQVMLIKNFDETLVNGSLGKVMAFMDDRTFDIYQRNESAFQPDGPSLDTTIEKLKSSIYPESGASTASQLPLVRFIIADGSVREILVQPEIWKIELPDGEVQASRTQIPLILAWALSIHKAQGQTLERVKVDLGKVFEKGQAYVALSRATCQEGLQVLRFDPKKVMAHDRVRTFYKSLSRVEHAIGPDEKDVKREVMSTSRPMPKPVELEVMDEEFDQDAEEMMGCA